MIHGYPLDGHSWSASSGRFSGAGYRVICVRPPRLRPIQPADGGYDYDTFAADLKALLEHLDLERRRARRLLDGHRRGRRATWARTARRGCARRRCSVSSRRSCSRPTTTPRASTARCSTGSRQAIVADRYAYFDDFFGNFYNVDVLGGTRISEQAWLNSFIVAVARRVTRRTTASTRWLTDFRGRPAEDRRTDARRPRQRRPDPAVRSQCQAAAGADQGPKVGQGRGRAAQHRVDPSGRGERGLAGLPRRVRRRRADSGPALTYNTP